MISDEIIANLVPQSRGIGDDLSDVGSFSDLNNSAYWTPKDNDEAELGPSNVVGCIFVSTSNNDPGIIPSVVNNEYFNIKGQYGLTTFDQISYEFTDIETNETFKKKGWPPDDPRAKYMFKLNIDPRDTVDVDWYVDFIVEFDISALIPPIFSDIATTNPTTYNLYVEGTNAYRRDRVNFIQTVRNYSFLKISPELQEYFKNQSYP